MKKLMEKVIIISGGTKGVGRAAAEAFAKEGACVVVAGRDETAGNEIVKEIQDYGADGLFVKTELHDLSSCRHLFQTTYEHYGKIDGFFNYAGVTYVSPLDSCDEETFDEIMDINFKSCFFCCQEAIQYMRLNGGGSIVFTGSAHAWGGQKDRAAYACSKGVLLTLMEHIAHNYASEQIRCNYLTLGWTPTEGELELRRKQGVSESELRKRASAILPMGRMCECTDYLEMLILLMSDDSKMMTGSTIRATAGEYI